MNKIVIITDPRQTRQWEHRLVARLVAAGHDVAVVHREASNGRHGGLDRVLKLEARRFGPSLASFAPPLPESDASGAELAIDLTGAASFDGVQVLRLSYSGGDTFGAGIEALLATGDLPEIVARLDGVAIGRAKPMFEDGPWLSRLSTSLLAAAVSLIEQSVARIAAGKATPLPDAETAGREVNGSFMRHYLPRLRASVAERVRQKLRRREFGWQVGYRRLTEGSRSGGDFIVLPDDGERFYADPFLVEHRGTVFLFVEEFPYATSKGIISVAEMGPDGSFGRPRPVLEEPFHLSYPQVIPHSGTMFMIPETSGARQVVLYRAEAFPDRWVRDSVLIADRDINDATLLAKDGRFWLIGTERRDGGSQSDTMVAFVADDLRGPYRPHPLNPLVIDRAAARPGGAFFRDGERLLLPLQDGTARYGGGLGVAEVVSLRDDEAEFGEPQPITAMVDGRERGIHTLNRAGNLEVVDWFV